MPDPDLSRRSADGAKADPIRGRARRVRKNLRQGLALAWAASPQSLIRYSVLGMISSAMPPIAVYLGALLVNRIAEAKLHALGWHDVLPIIFGLWASTGVKDPAYPDTLYVTGLVAADVVNTMPEKTLDATFDHGVVTGDTITGTYAESKAVLYALDALGISYNGVVALLESEGLDKFVASWKELLADVEGALATARKAS